MDKISGYKINEQIKVTNRKIIYRGYRESDLTPVIFKTLRADYPDLKEISCLKHEYEILKNLNLKGIINTCGLERYKNSFALILEDFGGESIHDFLLVKNIQIL
ncbi:hypothetical protein [Myxosarcina sp. GI1]|uniref:hypothetical protein n=1 Tax=Myxosarcina sp. GI1 TaxID=1541065 RepID=UPI000690C64C|nr:hypothetical protein [Myxosarcina sp. GI1]